MSYVLFNLHIILFSTCQRKNTDAKKMEFDKHNLKIGNVNKTNVKSNLIDEYSNLSQQQLKRKCLTEKKNQ